MAFLAIDLESKKLIDLVQVLGEESFEQAAAKYADKPNGYCCAECYARKKSLSTDQLRLLGETPGLLSDVVGDSSFRRGSIHQIRDLENGGHKPKVVRPSFFHTARLLDENGGPIQRPCESIESIHHAYCRWIAQSGRGWLLGTGADGHPGGELQDRHVISVMARYTKDPSFREPDISLLWAHSKEDADELNRRFFRGSKTIDWSLCTGLVAVEVQKSPISKPELIARTKDHLEHYSDVRWVFTKGNKPVPAREWLADAGMAAYIIEEETDKSRIIGICELHPPKKSKTYAKDRERNICIRAVMMYWLSQGCDPHEAMARANADAAFVRSGSYQQRLSVLERLLEDLYPNRRFDSKQIWLRYRDLISQSITDEQ